MRKELEKKIEQAIRLLKFADVSAKIKVQPVEIAYSGGKDSDVILELAKMSGIEYRAIYKATTLDPPHTIAHARSKGVEVIFPKKKFADIIEKNGLPTDKHRCCCKYFKEYKVLDVVVMGVRRSESIKRRKRYKEPTECRVYGKSKKQRAEVFYPILDWNIRDVAEFVKERNIQCHELYYDNKGNFHPERRLGCIGCPLKSPRLRIIDFKKYPNLLKLYVNRGKLYFENHPHTKTYKKYNGDICRCMVHLLFFYKKRIDEFNRSVGANMFDSGINCKEFLESYFNVKLD